MWACKTTNVFNFIRPFLSKRQNWNRQRRSFRSNSDRRGVEMVWQQWRQCENEREQAKKKKIEKNSIKLSTKWTFLVVVVGCVFIFFARFEWYGSAASSNAIAFDSLFHFTFLSPSRMAQEEILWEKGIDDDESKNEVDEKENKISKTKNRTKPKNEKSEKRNEWTSQRHRVKRWKENLIRVDAKAKRK